MSFVDHFGEESNYYQQFRPNYPEELFDFLNNLVKSHDVAWDCGTGNGQTAIALSQRFKKVIATDINQQQLEIAIKKDNICYYCWPAERTQIANGTIDLITVAQALHWFRLENFYQEVKRVAKPDAKIAAWCYSLAYITPEIDSIIKTLYEVILGDDYWPRERRYIDNEYSTILFPFPKLAAPSFAITKHIKFSDLLGYLNTWSAVKEFKQRNNQNPIDFIYKDLKQAWDESHTNLVCWPIHLLIGNVSAAI